MYALFGLADIWLKSESTHPTLSFIHTHSPSSHFSFPPTYFLLLLSQEHIAVQTPAGHAHGHAQHRASAKPAGEQIIESIALIDAKRRELGARLANTREYERMKYNQWVFEFRFV